MTNWIQKLGHSAVGMIIGLSFFGLSLGLLFWNENQFEQTAPALRAYPVNAQQQPGANLEGRLIAATGRLSSSQPLSDDLYLKPGEYLSLRRYEEIYAWEEKIDTQDGETVYSYLPVWTSTPADSSQFNQPKEHQNPLPTISEHTLTASEALVGQLAFDPSQTDLPPYSPLTLTEEILILPPADQEDSKDDPTPLINFTDTYVHAGQGTPEKPKIGDLRVSYEVVKPGQVVTVFGRLKNQEIVPLANNQTNPFYELKMGDYEEALKDVDTSSQASLWLWRVLGLGLMWLSLLIILSPTQPALSALPLVGFLAKNLFVIFTGLVALGLSLLTIYFSISVQNLFLLILLVVVLGGFLSIYFFRKQHSLDKEKLGSIESTQLIDKKGLLRHQSGKVAKAAGLQEAKQTSANNPKKTASGAKTTKPTPTKIKASVTKTTKNARPAKTASPSSAKTDNDKPKKATANTQPKTSKPKTTKTSKPKKTNSKSANASK
jgi:hypothetical protein